MATTGADAPYINAGLAYNRGVELALGWNDHVGDFNYGISGNVAYNKNMVVDVPNESGYLSGTSNVVYNNADACYRVAQEGYPMGFFWGYKTDGILQNSTEVSEYVESLGGKKSNTLQGNNIAAGDVRVVDVNGDGKITSADKTMIGNPSPDFTFGLSLNCSWKGFDFTVSGYGEEGNDIFQSYRNYASQYSNYTTAILNRWHGEGTSNTVPRVTQSNYNYFISDLFVHDGSFFRINNVQLGYDFKTLTKWQYLSQCRLYVQVQNLYTITAYDGFDPEVSYSPSSASSGIDLGTYPRSRTIAIGCNLKF